MGNPAVNEQPKLMGPGVADIEELRGYQEVKEKPSYVTRAVAARRRAGLDVELAPRPVPKSGGAR